MQVFASFHARRHGRGTLSHILFPGFAKGSRGFYLFMLECRRSTSTTTRIPMCHIRCALLVCCSSTGCALKPGNSALPVCIHGTTEGLCGDASAEKLAAPAPGAPL